MRMEDVATLVGFTSAHCYRIEQIATGKIIRGLIAKGMTVSEAITSWSEYSGVEPEYVVQCLDAKNRYALYKEITGDDLAL